MNHKRAQSQQGDNFKIIKKNNENKENVNVVNKSIEDKILQIEKRLVVNESYNDQYLLTHSFEKSVSQQKPQNLNSISFHLQSSTDQAASQMDRARSISRQQQHDSGPQPQDNAIMLLLNEFERRFQYLEERLDKSDRLTRQINQESKYNSEAQNQMNEKLTQINQKLQKLELRMKTLEEGLLQHKNQTDKRIIEFNNHVDQSLNQFINGSVQIQKKLDKLSKQQDTPDTTPLQLQLDQMKASLSVTNQNLSQTHSLLYEQMNEFKDLQSNIIQISNSPFLQQMELELADVKQQYNQTLQYLKTLQECLSG